MPTISFNYSDFEKLLGRKLPAKKFEELAILYAKAEVEANDNGDVKLSLDDTNLPYIWSVEGLARYFRGVLNIETGLAKLKVHDSKYSIIVEPEVKKYRPHIATFVAEGKKLDNYVLEQLIQLQEKFCDGYGRRRQKVSIGLYSHKKIKFPVHYRAVAPDSVSFVPLESSDNMKLSKILEVHPKGQQYGWIIKGFPKYPLLMDSNNEVLSLVPIINSDFTGKLRVGDSEMLFEATGTDEEAVNLAANIFAQNLFERGYKISSVKIVDGKKSFVTPKGFDEKMRITPEQVERLTGLKLSVHEMKKLLGRARYGFESGSAVVPDYRRDTLHMFDIIEDIAIVYGYQNMESMPLTRYTTGSPAAMNVFVDKVREIAIGLGLQEVLSPMLSNKGIMENSMEASNTGLVEIENVMSETYSAVRSWLAPVMLEVLSKNKHNDYPQRIFEQGLVSARKGSRIEDRQKLAIAISHTKTDFTEIKQCLDAIMGSLGVGYTLSPRDSATFVKGRVGKIMVNGKEAGVLGEIAPKVLVNWQLELPVVVLELDLSELFTST